MDGATAAVFSRSMDSEVESSGRPVVPWAGLNCSVLYTDVAGFSERVRDDDDRLEIRRVLYDLLGDALTRSGVRPADCYHEDRGDGVLLIAPPEVPTLSLLDPLTARLAAALRVHNRRSSEAMRIQLRYALSVGPVVKDAFGVSGRVIVDSARLLDAPVLKDALRSTGADLGCIVPEFVHGLLAEHRTGLLDADAFQRVQVKVKEYEVTAWMHLAGRGPAVPARPDRPPAPASSGPVFSGEVHVTGDLVLGDKFEFGR